MKITHCLSSGKARKAHEYALTFDKEMAKTMEERYSGKEIINYCDDEVLNRVLEKYQEYYVDRLWKEDSDFIAEEKLRKRLVSLLKMEEDSSLDDVENNLEQIFNEKGYQFLGGKTQGLYGPYAWKKTEKVTYEVELINHKQSFDVFFMDDFISLSWINFLTFGRNYPGGWQSGEEIYCVKKAYEKVMDQPRFQVNFLKHEAQHAFDRVMYPKIDSTQMEYRAKLMELIAYPDISCFSRFFNEASKESYLRCHPYASYMIIRELSKLIFEKDYQEEWQKWVGKEEAIKENATYLYQNFSIEMKE